MGRMKEEFMEMQFQMQDRDEEMYHELQAAKMDTINETQEAINQQNNEMSNNLNKIKMKNVKETEEVSKTETVNETRKDTLNRLFKENNLTKEDVYKDKRGFAIITRTGIDKIVSKQNITVAYEPVVMEKGWVVMKALATMGSGNNVRNMMSFGESSEDNLSPFNKNYPVAMAEKRAMSRVVLKIAGFYEQGIFGQDEIIPEKTS